MSTPAPAPASKKELPKRKLQTRALQKKMKKERTSQKLLEQIETPHDLRKIKLKQLPQVCDEVREYIIDTLSSVGGHFASNLGVVELTVALHYVYNTPEDKLIWDVGHQIYPHKILTGRRSKLSSVRKMGGLSGFPKREESPYDLYNTGHAGTSISQVLGEAIARDIQGKNHECVCVIGDASIASGMAFEAMNHGGHTNTDCIVVLNDNDMSISHNVGALNQYLNRLISSPLYNSLKGIWYTFLLWLPLLGPALRTFSKRLEASIIDFFTPGGFFSNLGFRYVGPVNGHDVTALVKVLRKLLKSKNKKPSILHVYTKKGQGYIPAEKNPIQYHSVSVFNRESGITPSKQKVKSELSYSSIVGETLLELAKKDKNLVAITPAMVEGSGLRSFCDAMPERVFDVGIAEQHGVSFAGALAAGGLVPYLCIYSTFLNRGLDQLIQDVALMNFPVRIVIDRAGCVGPDGETHQGLYDLGYLLAIPNIEVYAPSDGKELRNFLHYMHQHKSSPIAVRFPKGTSPAESLEGPINAEIPRKAKIESNANTKTYELGIIAIGVMWETAHALRKQLEERWAINVKVLGLNYLRPLHTQHLNSELSNVKRFIFIEDSYIHASASSYVLQSLDAQITQKHFHTFAFPTESIEQGSREEVLHKFTLSPEAIFSFLEKSKNSFINSK